MKIERCLRPPPAANDNVRHRLGADGQYELFNHLPDRCAVYGRDVWDRELVDACAEAHKRVRARREWEEFIKRPSTRSVYEILAEIAAEARIKAHPEKSDSDIAAELDVSLEIIRHARALSAWRAWCRETRTRDFHAPTIQPRPWACAAG
jgi:hypothetical protein